MLKTYLTAMRHPVRHISTSADQTIDGIYIQHIILFNENKSIP